MSTDNTLGRPGRSRSMTTIFAMPKQDHHKATSRDFVALQKGRLSGTASPKAKSEARVNYKTFLKAHASSPLSIGL